MKFKNMWKVENWDGCLTSTTPLKSMKDAMSKTGWRWIKYKIFIIYLILVIFPLSMIHAINKTIDAIPPEQIHTNEKEKVKDDKRKIDSYEDIYNKLSDPDFTHLDLRDLHLTQEKLEEIWKKLQGSNIGHISWGTLPQGAGSLVTKIENNIIHNNKKYKRHPSDFIHGLLSLHGYKNSTAGDLVEFDPNDENKIYNQYLGKWKVHKIFSDKASGYYSSLYINKQDRQVVLAHRGTTVHLSDLIKNDSPIKVDIKGILGGEIVDQQAAAFLATQYAVEYAQKNHYNLSITGHSLGAWLAELSLYYCHRDFAHTRVKAVTFDSPGSVVQLDKAKSNIINDMTDFDIKTLNIVIYLSAPNFVNSCNQHAGKVYRIFPEIPKSELTKKLSNFMKKVPMVKNNLSFLEGFLSISGHSLNFLLKTFDPLTGKPLKYEKVLDWPCIKYTPSGKMKKTLIDLIPGSNIIKGVIGTTIYKPVSDTTVVSLLTVMDEFINGNINQKQYWTAFKYIDTSAVEKGYSVKETLCSNDKFSLAYEGHYRTTQSDILQDVLSPMKGSSDWYLNNLIKHNIKLSGMSGKQLEELKLNYTIDIKDDGKEYISANIAVEDIREQIMRLIEVNSEAKEALENPSTSENKNMITIIENYLPQRSILGNYIPIERIQNFVGREEVFKQLDQVLNRDQYVVLNGFNGVGKSSAALEYAYRQKSMGKIVRWFNADSQDKIDTEYRKMAKELGLVTKSLDPAMIIGWMNNKINEVKSQIIFIFNNVEKYNDVKNHLMNLPEKVKVLITTRNNNLNESIQHIKLEPFSDKEATDYIKKNLESRVTANNINDLIKITGLLPYKLSQVVSYIKNNKFITIRKNISDIKKYIQNEADRSETDFLLKLLHKTPGNNITWQLLQYISYLDPDFMSIDIFEELLNINDKKLEISVKILEDFSLVNNVMRSGKYGLKTHRIVQEEVMQYTKNNPKKAIPLKILSRNLLKTLNNLFPEVDKVPGEDWKRSELIEAHVAKILYQRWNYNLDEQGKLYLKLSKYNRFVTSNFKKSLEYIEEALKIKNQIHQGNHPDVALSLANLGWAYYNLGNVQKGLKFHEQSLNMLKSLYQGNHPDIALSLTHVGWFYQSLGNAQKALIYHDQALKIYDEIGQNNPDYCACLNNMGMAFFDLGDLCKALTYHEKSLKTFQKLDPENKISYVKTFGYLGNVYRELGSATKALMFLEQALKIKLELYTPHHPSTSRALFDLGYLYQTLLDDPETALAYHERALKIRQDFFQGNHQDTAKSLYLIGWISYHLGDLEKAMRFHEQGLKMFKALYQGNHPDIAQSLKAVGVIYLQRGDSQKALTYLEQSLKMNQDIYPKNHKETARSLNYLGNLYQTLLDDPQKALKYHEQALKMKQELSPGDPIEISGSLNDIGLLYQTLLDDPQKALKYHEQALKMQKDLNKGNDSHTAASLNYIGMAQGALGEPQKALIYLEQALKIQKDVYPGNHPMTARYLNNIGIIYQTLLDGPQKALPYLENALKMRQELYQGNHLDIAESLHYIGMVQGALGYPQKALIYLEQALKMKYKILQKKHSTIARSLHKVGMAYGKLGDTAKEVEYYKQSYIMLNDVLGKTNSNILEPRKIISKLAPEFPSANETRSFIVERGDIDNITLQVKERIQFDILNPIHELAAKGIWYRAGMLWKSGVLNYLKGPHLKRKLGDLLSPETAKIAKMLCFEAINLGIMRRNNKNYTCTMEFSKAYPELIKEIIVKHPEYFVDSSIIDLLCK